MKPASLLILGDGPFAVEALDIAEAAFVVRLGRLDPAGPYAPGARRQ